MALLVLAGLFMLGMGVRYVQRTTRAVPDGAYAEVDSLLRLGSISSDSTNIAGQGRAGTGVRRLHLQPSAGETVTGGIDLNTATTAELERLPRIGPKLAERIVAYRETQGPFNRVQDLTRVNGIGNKTLERLEGLVYVEGEQ